MNALNVSCSYVASHTLTITHSHITHPPHTHIITSSQIKLLKERTSLDPSSAPSQATPTSAESNSELEQAKAKVNKYDFFVVGQKMVARLLTGMIFSYQQQKYWGHWLGTLLASVCMPEPLPEMGISLSLMWIEDISSIQLKNGTNFLVAKWQLH